MTLAQRSGPDDHDDDGDESVGSNEDSDNQSESGSDNSESDDDDSDGTNDDDNDDDDDDDDSDNDDSDDDDDDDDDDDSDDDDSDDDDEDEDDSDDSNNDDTDAEIDGVDDKLASKETEEPLDGLLWLRIASIAAEIDATTERLCQVFHVDRQSIPHSKTSPQTRTFSLPAQHRTIDSIQYYSRSPEELKDTSSTKIIEDQNRRLQKPETGRVEDLYRLPMRKPDQGKNSNSIRSANNSDGKQPRTWMIPVDPVLTRHLSIHDTNGAFQSDDEDEKNNDKDDRLPSFMQ